MTQAEALDILKTGGNVFLTGEPGAGKTHTINAYVSYLRAHGIEPAITASTGIAATHIGGMTIHSWSGIGIKDKLMPQDLDRISTTEYLAKRISRTPVIIIDEISMLDANTLDMVDAVCKEVRQNEMPFGGLQVILVGDFFQLPPVSRGAPAKFAFESRAWRELVPLVLYLTEQHRQDDSQFLGVLSALRRGEVEEEHFEHLQKRMGKENLPKEITRLFPHNANVDLVNDAELKKLPGDATAFTMTDTGTPALVGSLKKGCLSPEKLLLKKNAVVMFTKNNPIGRYVNGTLGVVENFSAAGNPQVRTREGYLIEVVPQEWVVEEGGKIKARIEQLPLRLAWALTVHKSQGVSLDAAVMDLSGAFEYGQGYVALSRVRRLSGLYLLGCNQRALQVHPMILTKDREFQSASESAADAFEKMSKTDLQKMHDNFIAASGGKKLTKKEKAKKEKKAKDAKGGMEDGPSRLEKIREKFPNAYRPWSDELDQQLRDAFSKTEIIGELSKQFGRQKGSIYARLVKLGLVEESI